MLQRRRVHARNLLPGDIVGSGETVVNASAGARTPAGKVDVTLTLHGCTRTVAWNAATFIGIERGEGPALAEIPARVQSRVVVSGNPLLIDGASRIATLPGIAPVTDRDRLQHRADAPLRANVSQRCADVGLFGGDRDQLDLIDAVRAATRDAAP
jgi:hypothetical protein